MAIEDGYSICLNEWALDKEIKNELNLLVIISSLTAKKGFCYASNKWFADLFNIDEVSVSRKLKKLELAGYITMSYKKRGFEVQIREIRLTKMLSGINKNVNRPLTNLLSDDLQICEATINKNVKYNITSNNITSNNITSNNTQAGAVSNKNDTTKILEEKKVVSKPRVIAPNLPAGAQLPNKVKAKLLDLKLEPACIKAITEYCLYLMDSYSFKDTALCKRIDDICIKGRNCTSAIQAICNYNIDRNYKNLYLPYDLSSTVAQQVAISEQATEDDFVRDENGNIEEIW